MWSSATTTLLCGQVGIAGSTRIGNNVVLAGQTGVGDNLFVGDNVDRGRRHQGAGQRARGPRHAGLPGDEDGKPDGIYKGLRRLPRLFAMSQSSRKRFQTTASD